MAHWNVSWINFYRQSYRVVKQLQIMIVIEISRVERKRTDLLNSKRTR